MLQLRTLLVLSAILFLFPGLAVPARASAPTSDTTVAAGIPAFPGAEGYGAASVGGRGGRVIEVTNLNDRGTGSLRKALEASDPRIIVFRVSGTIALTQPLYITHPYVTLAGQTAPGDGITLRMQEGWTGDEAPLVIRTHDVTVRYMRFRPGPGGRPDAISIVSKGKYHSYNVILDHISASWSVDKVIELATRYSDPNSPITRNVTIQDSIISEGLHCSTYPNECHSKGLMIGVKVENVTVYRNLMAHNVGRSPLSYGSQRIDLINNVIYYSGHRTYSESSEIQIANTDVAPGTPQYVNIIGNHHVRHPSVPLTDPHYDEYNYEILYLERDGDPVTDMRLYVAGNLGPHRPDESIAQLEMVEPATRAFLVENPHPGPAMTISSAAEAYETVLAQAGASFPKRDAVDARVVQEVRTRTGSPIDHPNQVGGWPVLASAAPPVDTDKDGMPDAWENQQGLNANNPADGPLDADGDGYTNVEEYVNALPLAAPSTLNQSGVAQTDGEPQRPPAQQVYLPQVCTGD